MRNKIYIVLGIVIIGFAIYALQQDQPLKEQDTRIEEQDHADSANELDQQESVNEDTTNQMTEEQGTANEEQNAEEQEEKDKVKAPNFTLEDGKGNEYTLSDYKGKIVFVNFWQTWCGPCVNEMPDFQKLHEKYNNDEVVILAINVQGNYKEMSQSKVIEWVEDKGYTFPILYDEEGLISEEYQIIGYPTNYIVDKEGYIATGTYGMTYEMMEAIIEQINK